VATGPLAANKPHPASFKHQCNDNCVVWKGENNLFHGNYMPIFTNSWWAFHVHHASYVELMPIMCSSFAIWRHNDAKDEGVGTKRWENICNEGSANLQHPASLLIVHPSSLCVVSHALPRIDTHKKYDMAHLLHSTNNNPHWLLGVQQFNSIAVKLAKYLPKRPFSQTVLMVKHDAINTPRHIRPFISHSYHGVWQLNNKQRIQQPWDSITYQFQLSGGTAS
jgi:hypothetical protein